MAQYKLRKGDHVKVLAGKHLGSDGVISRVLPNDMVIVDGVNMVKRHTKPRGQVMQGGIIDKEMPIHASNVAFVCKDCGPTRLGYRIGADGVKIRVCKKCEADA
jgi:large subunit ribosomal protein L24